MHVQAELGRVTPCCELRPPARGARTPQGCLQGCAPEGPAIKWRLFHLFVRPALRQEFFFGDHTLTLLEETKEHIKRFGLDGDPLACSSQFTSFCIEFTVAEMIDHTLYPGVTAFLPYPVPFLHQPVPNRQARSRPPPSGPILTMLVRIGHKMV